MFEKYCSEGKSLYRAGKRDARRTALLEQSPWLSMKLIEFSHVTEKLLSDFGKERALHEKRISELSTASADKAAVLKKCREEAENRIRNLPTVTHERFSGEEDLPQEIITLRRETERKAEIDEINADSARLAKELTEINTEIGCIEEELLRLAADTESDLLEKRDLVSIQMTAYLKGFCEVANFDPRDILGQLDRTSKEAVANVRGIEKNASAEVLKGGHRE